MHKLRICNTYCFFTATVATRTPSIITYILTLPVFFPCTQCELVHMYQVASAIHWEMTGYSRIMGSHYGTCCMPYVWRLECGGLS